MKKFFAKKSGDNFIFENEELAHFNVLRCRVGEEIICLCEDNYDYLCQVTEISKKHALAKIISYTKNEKNPKVDIAVFQALVKGEKLDLIVQKLTELGITSLYTFESKFTIAKENNNKLDRLHRVSMEACKQCGRSQILNLHKNLSFDEMLNQVKNYDLVLLANEKNTLRNTEIEKAKSIALIIGSEGGFDDDEIQKITELGAKNFGLGSRILRAETATIAMSSIVGYLVNV